MPAARALLCSSLNAHSRCLLVHSCSESLSFFLLFLFQQQNPCLAPHVWWLLLQYMRDAYHREGVVDVAAVRETAKQHSLAVLHRLSAVISCHSHNRTAFVYNMHLCVSRQTLQGGTLPLTECLYHCFVLSDHFSDDPSDMGYSFSVVTCSPYGICNAGSSSLPEQTLSPAQGGVHSASVRQTRAHGAARQKPTHRKKGRGVESSSSRFPKICSSPIFGLPTFLVSP